MIERWRFRKALENQLHNLYAIISGLPVSYPPFASMTLEHDDVNIAKTWLKKYTPHWHSEDIVREYQAEFCRWNGSKYAYAFMGGRVALSACIHALNLKPGDEVILPGYTCVVVPNAFHFEGIRTIYCDIELDTFGLDACILESMCTSNTRAILIHHLYGLVCRDYEKLLLIAKRHNIPVIEDCAQAMGATYKGVKVGNRGALSIYSSEQSKVINTVQGGLAVSNDDQLGVRLREYWENASKPDNCFIDKLLHNVLLNYYKLKHPQRWLLKDLTGILYGEKTLTSTTLEEEQGKRPKSYGAKMTDPIAALGLNQLSKIDRFNSKRRNTAELWDRLCRINKYQSATVLKESMPVFLRYPVLVEPEKKSNRNWAKLELGVDLGVWFKSNLHPVKCSIPDCPQAERAIERCINFPTLLS